MQSYRKHWLIFKQFVVLHKKDLLKTYIFVPVGVLLILCVLYGVDRLIRNVIKIDFPASVAVMLVNFAFMCTLSACRRQYVGWYAKIIDVPLSWSLRWMNLFFTPAFVTLPLSEWISFREAMLIVAVFVIGYMATFVLLAYITIAGQKLVGSRKRTSMSVRQEELENGMDRGSSFAPSSTSPRRLSKESASSINAYDGTDQLPEGAAGKAQRGTQGQHREEREEHDEEEDEEYETLSLINLASNSGLELSRSASATPIVPKTAAVRDTSSHIASPLMLLQDSVSTDGSSPSRKHTARGLLSYRGSPVGDESKTTPIQPPEPLLSKNDTSVTVGDSDSSSPVVCERAITRQFSRQVDHFFSLNMWEKHLHHVLYGVGFFASIFPYYFSWYIMPFQFFTAVVTFMFITHAPLLPSPKYKRFLHPVICSAALTWIIMLISVMIKYQRVVYFLRELRDYKTGRTYLHLFDNNQFGYHEWPGAGDIFSSCMDVSIVGLSMPMFAYRHDLRRHCLSMIPPILLLCAASLLLYPIICYHIGISDTRSIGFVGRSITLALGTPTINNLEGSVTIMAVTTVVSGIVGALTGGPMLDLIRVPENDYVTRGLTLGCNCGAIATAYLLGVDRRAAAISSLSFVLFGTFMVVLSSIGSVKDFVRSLVGL